MNIQELYNQKKRALNKILRLREYTDPDKQEFRAHMQDRSFEFQSACADVALCLAAFGNRQITPESIEHMRSLAMDMPCAGRNAWLGGVYIMERSLSEPEGTDPEVETQIEKYATEVFGSEDLAVRWLIDFNVTLNHFPSSLLRTPEGVERVRTLLDSIKQGLPA